MPPTTCLRTTQKSAAGKEYKKTYPGVVETFQEKLFWLWISQGGCCTEGRGTSKANWPFPNPSPSGNPTRAAPFSKKGRKNLEKSYLERPLSDKEARANPCHRQNKYRRPQRAQTRPTGPQPITKGSQSRTGHLQAHRRNKNKPEPPYTPTINFRYFFLILRRLLSKSLFTSSSFTLIFGTPATSAPISKLVSAKVYKKTGTNQNKGVLHNAYV